MYYTDGRQSGHEGEPVRGVVALFWGRVEVS